MKDAFIKLLKIKSIVTIVLTVVFAYLSVVGKIDADKFMQIFTVVIAFYFGTQTEKNSQPDTNTTIVNSYTEPIVEVEDGDIEMRDI